MNGKFRKYITVVALGLAGSSIYFLPYIKYVFYNAQMEAMNINNLQSGLLLTMYTIGNMILYVPGGILADKFSPKKSLIISLLSTTGLVFLYAFTMNFKLALGIWFFLSFSTAFVFWASLMKAIRMIADEKEQGFMYGLYYACNGLSGALIQSVALFVSNQSSDPIKGFSNACIVGGIFTLVAGISLIFLLDDTMVGEKEADTEEKFQFRDVKILLSQPIVWIVSLTILCGYGIYSSSTYFTPYLTNVVGISSTYSGMATVLRSYVFMLLAPIGGIIADKVLHSTSKWLSISFFLLAICYAGVLLLNEGTSSIVAVVYSLIPGAIGLMMYGVIFSVVSEAGVPRRMTGTIIGLTSIIGYLPDFFYSPMFGRWIDRSGNAGYNKIFLFLAGSAFIGAILSLVIYKKSKKDVFDQEVVTPIQTEP